MLANQIHVLLEFAVSFIISTILVNVIQDLLGKDVIYVNKNLFIHQNIFYYHINKILNFEINLIILLNKTKNKK